MKYYFAPMEGITGYLYRNAHHTYFPGVEKYFIPFIVPNQKGKFSSREENDVDPEHNKGYCAVPQILTNDAQDFIRTAEKLKEMGYREVNLNLGCPSRTVVSKARGAGFLAQPERIDRFLNQVFGELKMKISIKTRIGMENEEEFDRLLSVYNQYPLEELIIHPRLQKEFYKGCPHWEIFEKAVSKSRNPVCYNGDLFHPCDYEKFAGTFPKQETIMIGRGFLIRPDLLQAIAGQKRVSKETVRRFHDRLYEDYRGMLCGDKNVLFKMKEFWSYLAHSFTGYEKYLKKIRKAEKLPVYESAVEALFAEQELEPF